MSNESLIFSLTNESVLRYLFTELKLNKHSPSRNRLKGSPHGVRPMGFTGNGAASLLQRRPNGTDLIFDVMGPFHPGRAPCLFWKYRSHVSETTE